MYKKGYYNIGRGSTLLQQNPNDIFHFDDLEMIKERLKGMPALKLGFHNGGTFETLKELEGHATNPHLPEELRKILTKFKISNIITISIQSDLSEYFCISYIGLSQPRVFIGKAYESPVVFIETLIELKQKINEWSGGVLR